MSIFIILMPLIISEVQSIECNNTNNGNYLSESFENQKNQKYEWVVVIKDCSVKSNFYISYGFVISPQIILTSALAISGRKASDLLVRANCTSGMINCKDKFVKKIFLPNSEHTFEFYFSDYALLTLEKPFYYAINNPAFSGVQLTGNHSEINRSKCSIFRWKYNFSSSRFNKLSYDIYISEKNLVSIQAYEAEKLIKDKDGIIFSTEDDTNFKVAVSFYGSPIICEAVDNYHKKYLFGISIFDAEATTIQVNNTNNFTLAVNLVGSYFKIVDNYYQLQAKIYQAENYITEHPININTRKKKLT